MQMLNALVARLHELNNEKGATAVEYGLMVALIAAVIILAVTAVGADVNAAFNRVADAINVAP
ncbi:MAG: Flp family type IVb pilin [Actinomycetota bacterium]|nr:Flp family type IVb pilin [Actinomycetota bacterium]